MHWSELNRESLFQGRLQQHRCRLNESGESFIIDRYDVQRASVKSMPSRQKAAENVSNWLIINNGRKSSTINIYSTLHHTRIATQAFSISIGILHVLHHRLLLLSPSIAGATIVIVGCNCWLAFNYRVSNYMLPLPASFSFTNVLLKSA